MLREKRTFRCETAGEDTPQDGEEEEEEREEIFLDGASRRLPGRVALRARKDIGFVFPMRQLMPLLELEHRLDVALSELIASWCASW